MGYLCKKNFTSSGISFCNEIHAAILKLDDAHSRFLAKYSSRVIVQVTANLVIMVIFSSPTLCDV